MHPTPIFAGLIAIACGSTALAAPKELSAPAQRYSYTLGFQAVKPIIQQGVDLDRAAYLRGAEDAIKGSAPALTQEESQAAMQELRTNFEAKRTALADKNLAASKAFLAKNAKEPKVVTLPTGMQYKVLASGKGAQPKSTDTVTVHYRGTLANGTEFDSSIARKEPATFPVNGVIKGWQEILPMMKVGDKWNVYIPPEMAYGPSGAGAAIGPNEMLIFEIELLDVKTAAAEPKP